MLETMLDALAPSSLPKLPIWEARSLAEGNMVIDMLRRLYGDEIAWANQRMVQNPPTGFSITARREVSFEMKPDFQGNINFRESVWCPLTHVNARARSAFHLFLSLFDMPDAADIYMTEQTTPLFRLMRAIGDRVQGSEYLSGTPFGEYDAQGIRSEDLTNLTYSSRSFDGIISLDVLEHVPDYQAALGECARILRPGGKLIMTAPFAWTPEHIIRARVKPDGEIEHLLSPEYHGDPIEAQGILCFYWFGWELLENMKAAGFKDAYVALISSKEFGYLGQPHAIFVGVR
jgi:hypothetical protein